MRQQQYERRPGEGEDSREPVVDVGAAAVTADGHGVSPFGSHNSRLTLVNVWTAVSRSPV